MNTTNTTDSKEKVAGHTPIPPLSFDGFGINGGDEYMSRVATFTEHGFRLGIGERIVRACNSHDELLQLAYAFVNYMDKPTGAMGPMEVAKRRKEILDRAQDVIAKATNR